MSFLLVSRRSRVDFKKWKSLHQPDFKRDPNLGGFGNAEIRLYQPNVSRDVKKCIVGAEVGKSHRSSHEETLRLHNCCNDIMWLRWRVALQILYSCCSTVNRRLLNGYRNMKAKSTELA